MRTQRLQQLFGIEGKIAVVSDSGALSSIDVAPLLADAGATVIIADKDPESVARLVEGIAASGGTALGLPTDIESEAAVIALFDTVRERFGRLDVLVNCAGITANAPLTETTMALWDETQSINLRATFMLMREGVKLMVAANNGGRIVNITTMGSVHPVLNGNGAYSASRAGVTMLTKTTALDYAKDRILANLVLPGSVQGKTRFHPSLLSALQSGSRKMTGPAIDMQNRVPFGFGNGADIAAAVLYLVGPSASYITGQALSLDGGFLIT